MSMIKKTGLSALIATTALSACSVPTNNAAHNSIAEDNYRVDASFSRFGDRESVRPGGVQVSNDIYVGATRERTGSSASLPARVQAPTAVTLSSRAPMNLPTIAARLSEITGIHHVVSLGPTGVVVSAPAPTNAGAPAVAAPGQEAQAQAPQNNVSMPTVAGSDIGNRTMTPNFSGPLSRVLDEVSAVFDVEWAYEGGRIVMRDYVTRQYHISALPVSNSGSNSVGGSGGGGSSISSSSSVSIDLWSDIRTTLTGLAGQGSNISISPSTGMITVTARAGDQERIASYVRDVNAVSNQQLTFDVNVLTVTLNDSRSAGIDLNAIFRSSGGTLEGGARGNLTEGGSMNIGVVSGNWNLSAVVRALSSAGQVSVSQRAGTTTSNNRMAPVNVVDSTSYVKGVTFTRDSNGNIISSDPDIEEIDTGFQMQLLPRVLNNNEIMLQYSIRLSELGALREVTGSDGSYQLPQISETAMEQQAVLANGQTLVIAGFERNRVETNDSGISSRAYGIGGAREAETSRVSTVIMIRPTLIKR